MRVVIVGNSGSGKSTLARRLRERSGLPLLELDSIVWEPGKVAVLRAINDIERDLADFLKSNDAWVVEGCYGELAARALDAKPELVFLNPGASVCLENNQRRPWEPHKYASKEAQDEMLERLLEWVRDYYEREDDWSLFSHRKLFDGYQGPKREVTDLTGLTDF
jgi:adenylate kinase family enzyme